MNNYHIYEEIGKGKNSVVYKVTRLISGQKETLYWICSRKILWKDA